MSVASATVRHAMMALPAAAALALPAALAGCGQKGPLVLPAARPTPAMPAAHAIPAASAAAAAQTPTPVAAPR